MREVDRWAQFSPAPVRDPRTTSGLADDERAGPRPCGSLCLCNRWSSIVSCPRFELQREYSGSRTPRPGPPLGGRRARHGLPSNVEEVGLPSQAAAARCRCGRADPSQICPVHTNSSASTHPPGACPAQLATGTHMRSPVLPKCVAVATWGLPVVWAHGGRMAGHPRPTSAVGLTASGAV